MPFRPNEKNFRGTLVPNKAKLLDASFFLHIFTIGVLLCLVRSDFANLGLSARVEVIVFCIEPEEDWVHLEALQDLLLPHRLAGFMLQVARGLLAHLGPLLGQRPQLLQLSLKKNKTTTATTKQEKRTKTAVRTQPQEQEVEVKRRGSNLFDTVHEDLGLSDPLLKLFHLNLQALPPHCGLTSHFHCRRL